MIATASPPPANATEAVRVRVTTEPNAPARLNRHERRRRAALDRRLAKQLTKRPSKPEGRPAE